MLFGNSNIFSFHWNLTPHADVYQSRKCLFSWPHREDSVEASTISPFCLLINDTAHNQHSTCNLTNKQNTQNNKLNSLAFVWLRWFNELTKTVSRSVSRALKTFRSFICTLSTLNILEITMTRAEKLFHRICRSLSSHVELRSEWRCDFQEANIVWITSKEGGWLTILLLILTPLVNTNNSLECH